MCHSIDYESYRKQWKKGLFLPVAAVLLWKSKQEALLIVAESTGSFWKRFACSVHCMKRLACTEHVDLPWCDNIGVLIDPGL